MKHLHGWPIWPASALQPLSLVATMPKARPHLVHPQTGVETSLNFHVTFVNNASKNMNLLNVLLFLPCGRRQRYSLDFSNFDSHG